MIKTTNVSGVSISSLIISISWKIDMNVPGTESNIYKAHLRKMENFEMFSVLPTTSLAIKF